MDFYDASLGQFVKLNTFVGARHRDNQLVDVSSSDAEYLQLLLGADEGTFRGDHIEHAHWTSLYWKYDCITSEANNLVYSTHPCLLQDCLLFLEVDEAYVRETTAMGNYKQSFLIFPNPSIRADYLLEL